MQIQIQYNIIKINKIKEKTKKIKEKTKKIKGITYTEMLMKVFIPHILIYKKEDILSKYRDRLNIPNMPLERAIRLMIRKPYGYLLMKDFIRAKFTKYTEIFIKLFTHIILKQKPKSVTKIRQRRASKAKQLRINSTAFLVIFAKLFMYTFDYSRALQELALQQELKDFVIPKERLEPLAMKAMNREAHVQKKRPIGSTLKFLLPTRIRRRRRRRDRKAMKSKAKRMRRDDSNEKPEKTN